MNSIFDNWAVLDPQLERNQIDAALADVAGPGGVPIIANSVVPAGSLYFDVPLPLGYSFFSILGAFILSVPDLLAFAFSADAGGSFTSQASPADGYATVIAGSSLSPESTLATHSLGLLSAIPNVFTQIVSSQIFTGTTKLTANAKALVLTDDLHAGDPQTAAIEAALAAGTVSDIFGDSPAVAAGYLSLGGHALIGRQNLIRILPFGNGDIPPTSGHTLRGVWSLYASS